MTKKNSDYITIAIPVFERFDFFAEALNSAINQVVQCKIIVVDNCSSHSKFEEYVLKLNNVNILYYRNEKNLGMVGNWNKCLELVETEWITILHDDDLLYPNYIECFEIIRSNFPNSGCISSNYISGPNVPKIDLLNNVNPKVRFFKTKEFSYNILSMFPGIAINNKLNPNLRFDESMYPIADFDLWVRISKQNEIIKFSTVQAFYRKDLKQTTAKVADQIIRKAYLYRKHHLYQKTVFSNILFLATTIMSILSCKRTYGIKIEIMSYAAKEDRVMLKLMNYKILLYVAYIFKYSIYRFGLLFKFKSLKSINN